MIAAALMRAAATLLDQAATRADAILGYDDRGFPIRSGWADSIGALAASVRETADMVSAP
jgi:hypothetical protein